jgi:cytidylate kinase
MPIILISSDTEASGHEVARRTAEATGYTHLDRQILPAVASQHGLQEQDLRRALDELPTLLGLSSKLADRCLTCVQEAVLGRLLEDDVVCEGLAAHLYVRGVSHALRARVLSRPPPEDHPEAARETRKLKRAKTQRIRWSTDVFGVDETDASSYDVVISLQQIDEDEAVSTITRLAGNPAFQPMTYSRNCLNDLHLASQVRLALLEKYPDVRVTARGDTVAVHTKAIRRDKVKRTEEIKAIAGALDGVSNVDVHVAVDVLRQAADSSR